MLHTKEFNSSDQRHMRSLVEKGHYVQVWRGYYTNATTWSELYHYDKHRLRSIAVGHSLRNGALTGASAATVMGYPIRISKTTPIATVGNSKPTSTQRHRAKTLWVPGEESKKQQLIVDGFSLPVTSPAHCIAELACSVSIEEAVVALDHCLAAGLVDVDEMEAVLGAYEGKVSAEKARLAYALAEARTESPMETRLRLALFRLGLSGFIAQPEITLIPYNMFIRPDFFFPHHLLAVEYDGQSKYDDNPSAARADMERMHAAANCGISFLRINKDNFKSGAWIPELKRRLAQPPVPMNQDLVIFGGSECINPVGVVR